MKKICIRNRRDLIRLFVTITRVAVCLTHLGEMSAQPRFDVLAVFCRSRPSLTADESPPVIFCSQLNGRGP